MRHPLRVMRRNDQSHADLMKSPENLKNDCCRSGIEIGRWLIGEQYRRTIDHRPGNGQTLLVSEGALPPGDVFWLPRAVGGWLLEHA